MIFTGKVLNAFQLQTLFPCSCVGGENGVWLALPVDHFRLFKQHLVLKCAEKYAPIAQIAADLLIPFPGIRLIIVIRKYGFYGVALAEGLKHFFRFSVHDQQGGMETVQFFFECSQPFVYEIHPSIFLIGKRFKYVCVKDKETENRISASERMIKRGIVVQS